MNVYRQENILRYLVDSRKRVGVQHCVELDLYDGNGGCTCEDFTFRLEPILRAGAVPNDFEGDALRCDHIKAARTKLVDDIIANVAHKPALATAAPAPRQPPARVPPGRYSAKPRKAKPRPAQARR